VAAAAIPNLRHCEWFADHVDVDRLLFDGLSPVSKGRLPVPDQTRRHGITLRADAERHRVV